MANFLRLEAKTCDLVSFVQYWSSLYSYGDDDYLAHIRLGEELRREDPRLTSLEIGCPSRRPSPEGSRQG